MSDLSAGLAQHLGPDWDDLLDQLGHTRPPDPVAAARYAIERSITCPVCGWTSHHPADVAHGYCGHCHAFTSPPRAER
jgi:hypothetical protein